MVFAAMKNKCRIQKVQSELSKTNCYLWNEISIKLTTRNLKTVKYSKMICNRARIKIIVCVNGQKTRQDSMEGV